MNSYDLVIVGSGPGGMGTAFATLKMKPNLSILIIDRERVSTGRNTEQFYLPIGFPEEY